jgi:hypothetical protein
MDGVACRGFGNWHTPEQFDAQEVVRHAAVNFNARESLPDNYTYVESARHQ